MKALRPILCGFLAFTLLLCTFACNKEVDKPPVKPDDPIITPTPDVPSEVIPDPEPEPEPDPEPEPEPLDETEVTTLEVHDEIHTVDEELLIAVRLDVPYVANCQSINDYYTQWVSDMQDYIALNEEYAQQSLDDSKSNLGEFYGFAFESDYEVTLKNELLLSLRRDLYESLGGAHPNYSIKAETFVLDSGAMLTLDDFFTAEHDEYFAALGQIVVEQMIVRLAEYGEGAYFSLEPDYVMEMLQPRDFYLTPTSIVLFFNTNSIAPYAVGVQEFEIPFNQLTDLIDGRWIT